MEEGECVHFVPLDLDHEHASLSMLVFVLHEDSWEYDSYWCFGLWKDESYKYLKGGNSVILKEIYWLVFERIEKIAKYSEVGFVFKKTSKRG
jgi:hypothetical protein